MGQQIDLRAVESILYGIYKATYSTMGDSAASLMRKVAPEILNMIEELGGHFSGIDDIEKLEPKLNEILKKIGLCDNIILRLKDDLLTADIVNCSFFRLTTRLRQEGIPPFGCFFALLTIAIAERNLKKKARVKTIEPMNDGEGNERLVVQLF